jgi:hypothetical protein
VDHPAQAEIEDVPVRVPRTPSMQVKRPVRIRGGCRTLVIAST